MTVEALLYLSYQAEDATFHWFTHLFVGASAALLVMAVIVARTRRPVRLPLLWPVLGHLAAALPDALFSRGIAHERWMDLFLGHVSAHALPGRNLSWYALFLAVVAIYLAALWRRVPARP